MLLVIMYDGKCASGKAIHREYENVDMPR